MRILVHDFAGHPFQAQLSRELARRGHEVTHAYCGGVTTGRGDLSKRTSDPPTLAFEDVSKQAFERYSPLRRLSSEWRYGLQLAGIARGIVPDAVISANTPLLAQALLWSSAKRLGATRIYWLQDFLGRGTRLVLRQRSPFLGDMAGAALERLEAFLLRHSDAVMAIADDFIDELDQRGIRARAALIENWAPLDELTPSSKVNQWSRAHGLHERPVALYAGTLGLKHDPEHLVETARALRGTDAALVVVTEGLGREALERARGRESLENLLLFDYVPYGDLPHVLGVADVCLVLLEKTAGRFSVPSKTLTYLAAGCPIVAAIPAENLGARTIRAAGAGVVVEPGSHRDFASAVHWLLRDEQRLIEFSVSAREYAQRHFAVRDKADRVETLLSP